MHVSLYILSMENPDCKILFVADLVINYGSW